MIAVRKLPACYAPVVMPLVLSVLMTFVVSMISTLRSLGPTQAFLATWPGAWASGCRWLWRLNGLTAGWLGAAIFLD